MSRSKMEFREVLQGNNSLKDYEWGQRLNTGTFATIYVVRNRVTKKDFAIKVVESDDISEAQCNQFMDELLMLRQLEHPNIINPEICWADGTRLGMLLPLMAFRSCEDIIQNNFPYGISEQAMGQILAHILPAIEYIHERKIIHRCIKGSHILVNHNGAAILSGFKLAINVTVGTEKLYSTDLIKLRKYLYWLSPEMLAQDSTGYSFNSDIYSLGITILELCNGVVPFIESTPAGILCQKRHIYPEIHLWDGSRRPPFRSYMPNDSSTTSCIEAENYSTDSQEIYDMMNPSETTKVYKEKWYSKDFKSFTDLCVDSNKASRGSVVQLKKHKFMKGFFNLGQNNLITALSLDGAVHFQHSPAGDHGDQLGSLKSESSDFDWNFD